MINTDYIKKAKEKARTKSVYKNPYGGQSAKAWSESFEFTISILSSALKSLIKQEREELLKEVRLEIATYSPISAKATKELIEIIKSLEVI